MKMWESKTTRKAFINGIKMFGEKCEEVGHEDGKNRFFLVAFLFFTILSYSHTNSIYCQEK